MSKDVEKPSNASHQQRILRVLSYIKIHLDEPLDLDQLAELAFFSPHHFHRIFSSLVGETVKEHVRRLKLQRAMLQLATTARSITDIALDAGFNSLEAFSRVIKSQFETTPSDARKGMKAMLNLAPESDIPLDVSLVKLPALDLAYVRHIGCYADAAKAWLKLVSLTGMKDVIAAKQMRIGIAYDHPSITAEEKCCYDACIAWSDKYKEGGELGRMTIAAGSYVMFKHIGGFETIDKSYQKFAREWISCHEINFNDRHSFMWYKNTALLTKPSAQITECYFPIS